MKATDHLMADHKLIRKLLPQLVPENPDHLKIQKTLFRTVLGHAWFEDEIFIPSFKERRMLHKLFTDEIEKEHKDLAALIRLIHALQPDESRERQDYLLQMKAILTSHLQKEEDALFPMAEDFLKEDGLLNVGQEMEKRKTEIRDLVKEFY